MAIKLIDQTAELVEQELTFDGLLKHIEKCGRVCYKSEDRISENSSVDFVMMLLKNKHYSPLEHGMCYDNYYEPHNSKYVKTYTNIDRMPRHVNVYNARFVLENKLKDKMLLLEYLSECWTETAPTKPQRRVSFHVTTSRGVLDELLRHRVLSASVESTRFCNYTKDKFDNQITFIKPFGYDMMTEQQQHTFTEAFNNIESCYNLGIHFGLKPQLARDVLPLGVKSEAYLTAFVDDWIEICKKRIVPAAHPAARELCQKILSELFVNGYVKSDKIDEL